MSIPNSRVLQRRPIHPGEMLLEDFMPDYSLTVSGQRSGQTDLTACTVSSRKRMRLSKLPP